ncbi:MAG TPA: class II aldolase/adducin family protein [Usitatibacteraceae bacterium]
MSFLDVNHRPDLARRREVIATAIKMNALGINQGKSGNVSVRVDGGFLITPTGVPYEETKPEQIVAMRMDGTFDGDTLPSSEWRFHRDIYVSREEVSAIVHTHSAFATTIACLAQDIPAFHYMIAIAGGKDIRCAPYATFGTQQLSDHALAALQGRHACLLAQHGMIALGPSLPRALAMAVEVESLARMYWQTLQIGKPALLADSEMATVLDKFETYGQQALKPPLA